MAGFDPGGTGWSRPPAPDLERVIEQVREFFRGPGRWRLGVGALLVLVVVLLWSGWFTVQPEETGVVQRFGAVVRTVEPGLHFKLPYGIETVRLVPTARVLKEEFGFRTVATPAGQRTQYADKAFKDVSLMLTGDLNVIDVQWIVQYRIEDPIHFLFHVRNTRQTIRDIAEAVMRRVVGNRLGSDVLTVGRVAVSTEVKEEMQKILTEYETGVRLVTVELQDVTPPDSVKPAFNEVNEARQDRERTHQPGPGAGQPRDPQGPGRGHPDGHRGRGVRHRACQPGERGGHALPGRPGRVPAGPGGHPAPPLPGGHERRPARGEGPVHRRRRAENPDPLAPPGGGAQVGPAAGGRVPAGRREAAMKTALKADAGHPGRWRSCSCSPAPSTAGGGPPGGHRAVRPARGGAGDPRRGLHVKLPFIQEVRRFEKRLLIWDGDPNQIPTKGREFIWVDTTARWRIADAKKFLESVATEAGAQSRLNDIIDSVVRDQVSGSELVELVRSASWEVPEGEVLEEVPAEVREELTKEVTRGREEITRTILTEARRVIPQYGIELVDVRIKRLNYVESVREKVYARMISERKRIAAHFRSEGEGRSAEILGTMEKELRQIRSTAYRRVQETRGKADAEATEVYGAAYQPRSRVLRLLAHAGGLQGGPEQELDADSHHRRRLLSVLQGRDGPDGRAARPAR